jgi:Na+-translocating ferredoxin:NAD+ oxidoreductase subunit D
MNSFAYDGVTGATPLSVIRNGGEVNLLDMLIGTTAGTIGETSIIAILIGAVYLLLRKIITYRIPVFYVGTFAIFILIFSDKSFDFKYLLAQVLGGGLMLGAFFMATDYSTSPITRKGHVVYGIILGLLTGIFRVFGASPEGVSFAILFGNLLVPLIEKVTMPNMFGKGEKARG